MSKQEVAKEVLRLLGKNGERWCKYDMYRGTAMCLLGATIRAVPKKAGIKPEMEFYKAIETETGALSVASFNDANATTWPKVKTLLLKIAREA